jgi:hypothetical protein
MNGFNARILAQYVRTRGIQPDFRESFGELSRDQLSAEIARREICRPLVIGD